MFYVYMLLCSDGTLYVGYTQAIKERLSRHKKGYVNYTSTRLPIKIVAIIALPDQYKAIRLEDYLKTGSGRAFAIKHLI